MDISVDLTFNVHGPRNSYWYPFSFTWTNEFQVKDLIGESFMTFNPDYSNPYI